jgi:Transposase, Mutator family
LEGPQDAGRAAASAEAAPAALDAFEDGEWGRKFPTVVAAWRRAWDQVIPFFTFPPEIRRVIYTTNAIESVNARVRKIIKTRGHFPTDDAANKLIWLALRNITAGWSNAAHNWKEAMNQFAILYDDRFNAAGRPLGSIRFAAQALRNGENHAQWPYARRFRRVEQCRAPGPPSCQNAGGSTAACH